MNAAAINRIYIAETAILLLLGAIHTGLSPFVYPPTDPAFFWFAGTGLALIFGGFANLMSYRTFTLLNGRLALLTNVLITLLGAGSAYGMNGHIPSILVTITGAFLIFCSAFRLTKLKL